MSDVVIGGIFGVGGTVIGVLLGWVINRNSAHKAAIAQNFSAAGNEFKIAWLPAFIEAKTLRENASKTDTGAVIDYITKNISGNIELRNSVIKFERLISAKDRIKLNSLCDRLINIDAEGNKAQYYNMFCSTSEANKIEAFNNFYNTVNEIIKFTEN